MNTIPGQGQPPSTGEMGHTFPQKPKARQTVPIHQPTETLPGSLSSRGKNIQEVANYTVDTTVEKTISDDLEEQIAILIGEDEIKEAGGKNKAIKQWIETNLKEKLDQNWAIIIDKVTEAIRDNLQKNDPAEDWITQNIENGDIEQWIDDNLENSYENKEWAITASHEKIQNWVLLKIIQNKTEELMDQDGEVEEKVTSFLKYDEDGKSIYDWIEDMYYDDPLDAIQRAKSHGPDDQVVKQLILDIVNGEL